jgi:hypothetical protein
MRIIATDKKNKTIQSPWYRTEDAAAYCGLSRSAFDDRAFALPHAGKYALRIYHEKILDQWLMGELGIPFDKEEPAPEPRRITHVKHVEGYTHPRTGKFVPSVGLSQ